MRNLSTAVLGALALATPTRADQLLEMPWVNRLDPPVILPEGLTLGRIHNKRHIVMPGALSLPQDDSRLQLDVLRMAAKPNLNGGLNTLAKFEATPTPLTGGNLGQVPFQKSARPKDVIWANNCLNIEAFGGLADGVSDNSPALDAALEVLPAGGGCIYSPRGKRLFSRPVTYTFATANQSVTIAGDGQNNTEWFWPNTDGLILIFKDSTTTFHARDMAFTTGQVSSQNGIKIMVPGMNPNGALGEYTDFTRVTFRGADGYAKNFGWKASLVLDNVSNVNVDGSSFIGTGGSIGTGITTNGFSDDSLGVIYNIVKSSFVHLNIGINYGSYVQGMTIAQSNFTAVTNGVYIPLNALGILSQLTITANQFATNPSTQGAAINSRTGVNPLIVTGNLFLSNGLGKMIDLAHHSFTNIAGNQFYSPVPQMNTAIDTGIGGSNSKINDNIIFGFATGINLTNQTGNMSVTNNNIGGSTAAIVNASLSTANNRLTGNAGFQPQAPDRQNLTTNPWTYTSTALPSTVCVTGGSVSNTKVDGVTIANGSPGCVSLEPNENIMVTYTAPPNVTIGIR